MSYEHEDNLKFDDVNLNEVLFKYDIRDREKWKKIRNIIEYTVKLFQKLDKGTE